MRIVLDTNVLVAGLRSKRGRSFRLLSLIGAGRFELAISVPLVLEYEEVLKRQSTEMGLTERDVDDVLDYLCSVSHHQSVYFLWRPTLQDPDDDMILELASAAECQCIVTHNIADYAAVRGFGIEALRPVEFLRRIGELP